MLTLRAKELKSQFNKESLSEDIDNNLKEIDKIDTRINQKQKIRDGIKAGTNCIIRKT